MRWRQSEKSLRNGSHTNTSISLDISRCLQPKQLPWTLGRIGSVIQLEDYRQIQMYRSETQFRISYLSNCCIRYQEYCNREKKKVQEDKKEERKKNKILKIEDKKGKTEKREEMKKVREEMKKKDQEKEKVREEGRGIANQEAGARQASLRTVEKTEVSQSTYGRLSRRGSKMKNRYLKKRWKSMVGLKNTGTITYSMQSSILCGIRGSHIIFRMHWCKICSNINSLISRKLTQGQSLQISASHRDQKIQTQLQRSNRNHSKKRQSGEMQRYTWWKRFVWPLSVSNNLLRFIPHTAYHEFVSVLIESFS